MRRGDEGMEKFKLLIVDDEQDFLETIIKRLKARGIDVTGVESGYKALEVLEGRGPDVIILDVKMPGMDGIETLREIKKKHPLVEVIMLTGHASVESGIQGMQLGAFDYVMKPVALDELLEKVRQAYDRKLIPWPSSARRPSGCSSS
jgi:two-component system OmpR family response regulator